MFIDDVQKPSSSITLSIPENRITIRAGTFEFNTDR